RAPARDLVRGGGVRELQFVRDRGIDRRTQPRERQGSFFGVVCQCGKGTSGYAAIAGSTFSSVVHRTGGGASYRYAPTSSPIMWVMLTPGVSCRSTLSPTSTRSP